MTIGIAAYGTDAGAAVAGALETAERLGRGEIGGFAVFAALRDGHAVFFTTQRGGLAALRRAWRDEAAEASLMAAPVAAIISSGPDRPLPLTRFLAGGAAGLVTGHRRPDRPGTGGVPINRQALARLEAGDTPQAAVEAVVSAHPDSDVGLIAVTRHDVALGNSRLVDRRPDIGRAILFMSDSRAGLAVLHNSIDPVAGFAAAVARAGLAVLSRAVPGPGAPAAS